MKIYVNVGGTSLEREEFQTVIKESDFHGEWDTWTGRFIFEEDNDPDGLIEELEELADDNGLKIKCEIEY